MGEAEAKIGTPGSYPEPAVGPAAPLYGWCGRVILLPRENPTPGRLGYRPGPGVPPDIGKGLIEIDAAIREDRNPKGAMALSLDVLDRILAYGKAKWPTKVRSPSRNALSGGAEAALSLLISAAFAIAMVFVIGPKWAPAIGSEICAGCGLEGRAPVGVTVLALAGLFAGAMISLVAMRAVRDAGPAGQWSGGNPDEPPSRTDQLEALEMEGVITRDLLALAKSIGINALKPAKPGVTQLPPVPPPAPANTAGVRSVGSFVLTLADQVFDVPRRVEDARIGQPPTGAGEKHDQRQDHA